MADNIFVLDSNVWISFIIGKKLNILADIIIDHDLVVLNCHELEKEISTVLKRTKFKKYIAAKDIEEALILFSKLTNFVVLGNIKKLNRDKNDDFLFTLCKVGKAGYFVSGDKDILECGINPPPLVIAVNAFIKMFK